MTNPNAGVIVTLGQAVEGNRPSPETIMRLEAAANHYWEIISRLGSDYAPMLIMSGGFSPNAPEGEGKTEAEAMINHTACKLSVPRGDMLPENESDNTIRNFVYVRRLMERERLGRNAVVYTTDTHVRRSQFIADFVMPKFQVEVVSAGAFPDRPNQIPSEVSGMQEARLVFSGVEPGDTDAILANLERIEKQKAESAERHTEIDSGLVVVEHPRFVKPTARELGAVVMAA